MFMRLLAALCLLFTPCVAHAFLSNIETDADGLSLVLEAPAPGVDSASGLVSIEGAEMLAIPGEPSLPVVYVRLALPAGADLGSLALEIGSAEYREPVHGLAIPPTPELLPNNAGDPAGPYVNSAVYGADALYPAEPLALLDTSRLGSVDVATLAFFPCRYNPLMERLDSISRLTARLHYASRRSARRDPLSPVLDQRAARLLPNYRQVAPAAWRTAGAPGYAIITTNAVVSACGDAIDAFTAHKNGRGFAVTVATEDEWGAMAGTGNAQKIRGWLQANYLGLNLEYVLLVGNPHPSSGDVPMVTTWPRPLETTYRDAPTDYYYADLTGDWDIDGDGKYGEYEDEYNNMADAVDPSAPFAIRWSGQIYAPEARTYSFSMTAIGAASLTIDGGQVMSRSLGAGNASGTADLTLGWHDVVVEFYQSVSDGRLTLSWDGATEGTMVSLAYDQTRHWETDAYVDGLLESFWDNASFSGEPSLSRTQVFNYMNYTWATGDLLVGGMDRDYEVMVGRIPVYGSSDYANLESILQKSIDFENGDIFSQGRNHVLLPMKPSDSSTPGYHLGETVRDDFCTPAGFGTTRVYQEGYGLDQPADYIPCTYDNTLAAWQATPPGIVLWWTHGSSTLAADIFKSDMCPSLDDATPAFTFQVSCTNGYPEYSGNLGAALLRNGSVGTVSASRVSWYYLGQTSFTYIGSNASMGYRYTGNLVSGMTAGEALWPVRSATGLWSYSAQLHMNAQDFNLYGDPSLALMPGPTRVPGQFPLPALNLLLL